VLVNMLYTVWVKFKQWLNCHRAHEGQTSADLLSAPAALCWTPAALQLNPVVHICYGLRGGVCSADLMIKKLNNFLTTFLR